MTNATLNHSNLHSFHVPVMGIAFTIDSPIKLAPYGISSVISLVDDELIEQMREYYSKLFSFRFEPIIAKEFDSRANRITAYLNMVKQAVDKKFEQMFEGNCLHNEHFQKYMQLLPSLSPAKQWYQEALQHGIISEELKTQFKQWLRPGDIDVNIMTKLDKENSFGDEKLTHIHNDAHAALRGFAQSDLSSSVVLSAGLNPRLYSYFSEFKDFFPDALGKLKKRVILKISDYRSALIQGKFLAKKGIWVSEFRMESGLNCGGHAFATDGLLMGPILEEFKNNRLALKQELFGIYQEALKSLNYEVPSEAPLQKFTAQGGVGTAQEHQYLLEQYQLDSVGWGTPFLLVPEATTVDEATMQKLCEAKETDLYLSYNSPLGVRFNNIRNLSMDAAKEQRIMLNRAGSPCPKRYSVMDKTFTEEPICTASRQFQHYKLEQLKTDTLEGAQLVDATAKTLYKECLCVGLSNAALIQYNIPQKHYKEAVSICPGPNMAYFSKVVSLSQMVEHIYGGASVIERTDRPHVFIKELGLYINFLAEAIAEASVPYSKQQQQYFSAFIENLRKGISYYQVRFEPKEFDAEKRDLEALQARLEELALVL
jgi:hypothetical protein